MSRYKLKAAMDEVGVTVKEVAELLNLSENSVYSKRRKNSFYLQEAFDIIDLLNSRGGSYEVTGLFK